MIETIGFVGVGVMGGPMCRHLAQKSGKTVLVSDRNTSAVDALSQFGAKAATIAEIAEGAQLIFMSLPSKAALKDVMYNSEDGLVRLSRATQIIVDLSTSPVGLTRQIAKDLAAKGVEYCDAPVMRTKKAAEEGTLAVAVGGNAGTFDIVKPFIDAFATSVSHVGSVGCGQIVKLMNNMIVYETVMAMSEARGIAAKAGMDPAVLFEALSHTSADSFSLRHHGIKFIVPQLYPEHVFPAAYAKKDIEYALELADDVGIDARGARVLHGLLEEAVEKGYGDRYAPVINLLLEGK